MDLKSRSFYILEKTGKTGLFGKFFPKGRGGSPIPKCICLVPIRKRQFGIYQITSGLCLHSKHSCRFVVLARWQFFQQKRKDCVIYFNIKKSFVFHAEDILKRQIFCCKWSFFIVAMFVLEYTAFPRVWRNLKLPTKTNYLSFWWHKHTVLQTLLVVMPCSLLWITKQQ